MNLNNVDEQLVKLTIDETENKIGKFRFNR
jgi:hypothetical protein